MSITNGYCTLAELKTWLGTTTTIDDTLLEDAVEAASRKIDRDCDRAFYQLAATARIYTAGRGDYLPIDDLVSVTTLKTDEDGDRTYEQTWATTDYDLTPDNASDVSEPYTAVLLSPRSTKWFPTLRRSVQITGTWGWPAVPDAIKTATLILASRLVKRKDSPLGVAGSSALGEAILLGKADPDVAGLIAPYRRMRVGAI